jgi:hypothetical protein
LGDIVKKIGEAPLGICFPLKAHSSYPMHPVPHFYEKQLEHSDFFTDNILCRLRDIGNNKKVKVKKYNPHRF